MEGLDCQIHIGIGGYNYDLFFRISGFNLFEHGDAIHAGHAKIAQDNFSDSGVYAVAAIAGLTDVDAITLSMAELAKTGDANVAVIAIVIAALVNTAVKCGIAFVIGGAKLGKPLLLTLAAMLGAGLAGVLWL